MSPDDLARFETSAAAASRLLKAMAHDSRLLVLCQLAAGELQAGQIASRLSQSALSQHLALLRTEGLVATRRDGLADQGRQGLSIRPRALARRRRAQAEAGRAFHHAQRGGRVGLGPCP